MYTAARSAVAILAFCCASCAAESNAPKPITARTGDPAVIGKAHLLSESDFRTVLLLSRQWLAQHMPKHSVHEIEIYSSTSVGACFEYSNGPSTACLMLQRIGGQWRITSEPQFGLAEKVRM
jgi:hypothetical protein